MRAANRRQALQQIPRHRPQTEHAEIDTTDVERPSTTSAARLDELAHGYTLAALQDIATAAAARNWHSAADFRDITWTAQSAIVDHLLTTTEPPTRHDLATIARAAIWDDVRTHRSTYGYRDRDPWAGLGSAPQFAAYWCPPADEPAQDRLVERLAVTQLVAALRPSHRKVLLVAAAYDGDHEAAAAATGRSIRTWQTALRVARTAATHLWHSPETPARRRLRRQDRRRITVDVQPCGTYAAARRHRTRHEPLCPPCAAAAAKYDRDRKRRQTA